MKKLSKKNEEEAIDDTYPIVTSTRGTYVTPGVNPGVTLFNVALYALPSASGL
jgi:hypothetical protein